MVDVMERTTNRTKRIGVRAHEGVFNRLRQFAANEEKTGGEWCSDPHYGGNAAGRCRSVFSPYLLISFVFSRFLYSNLPALHSARSCICFVSCRFRKATEGCYTAPCQG